MDPRTRKRKLIDGYDKDLEIAALKKQLLIEKNNHLFYSTLNYNNQLYMNALNKRIKEVFSISQRIALGKAINSEFQLFAKATQLLNIEYKRLKENGFI